MDNSIQSLDQVKSSALDMAVRFGPKLVVALIILFFGHLVGRWVGPVLEEGRKRYFESLLKRSLICNCDWKFKSSSLYSIYGHH